MCFLTQFIFQQNRAQNMYFSNFTAPKGYFKLVGAQAVYFSSSTAPKGYFKLVGAQEVTPEVPKYDPRNDSKLTTPFEKRP